VSCLCLVLVLSCFDLSFLVLFLSLVLLSVLFGLVLPGLVSYCQVPGLVLPRVLSCMYAVLPCLLSSYFILSNLVLFCIWDLGTFLSVVLFHTDKRRHIIYLVFVFFCIVWHLICCCIVLFCILSSLVLLCTWVYSSMSSCFRGIRDGCPFNIVPDSLWSAEDEIDKGKAYAMTRRQEKIRNKKTRRSKAKTKKTDQTKTQEKTKQPHKTRNYKKRQSQDKAITRHDKKS
jgi:hypothetical protein